MHWMFTATQKIDSWEDRGQTSNVIMTRKLINHGSIKLKLQHYSDESFQDHSFYVVETRTPKDIIVRCAASIRLGLLEVLCKNISKSVSAIENKTNTSSRDSFQDHYLKIDGKTSQRNQRVASKSFQDHPPSSFKTMARCTCNDTPFKTPANTQGRRKQLKLTLFQDPWCRWHKSHWRNVHWDSFQDPSWHLR